MSFSVWKYSSTYIVRNQKQRCWRWFLVFLMGGHQSSYVSSRIRPKTSFLDDCQKQQDKCECFSVLITVSVVLVLKMRYSAGGGVHKSWSSWLCIFNPLLLSTAKVYSNVKYKHLLRFGGGRKAEESTRLAYTESWVPGTVRTLFV